MRKYEVKIYDVITAYPAGSHVNVYTADQLATDIGNGYEIIAATSLSTENLAGVQYVLQKEVI